MPFSFEMGRRQQNARTGLRCLRPHTDTLISIPNDRLLNVQNGNLTLDLAFRLADDILRQGVQGISELASHPGTINVDFANIRHLMKLGGGALMAIGQGQGDGKALQAIHQAIHHPLLDIGSIENAAGLLVNFTSGDDLTLFEVEAALTELQSLAGGQAEIVFGVVNDPRMQDRLEAILVVTGLGAPTLEEAFGQVPAQAFQSAPPRPNAQPVLSAPPPETVSVEAGLTMPIPVSKNLDIPAFMRRVR
jgi:cell division protein FtsZ